MTVPELIKILEERGYEVFTDNSESQIEIFLAFSEQMKPDFRVHGGVLSFDQIFNLVKDHAHQGSVES